MKLFRALLVPALAAAALLAPAAGHADPVVTNPFGDLGLRILAEPNGATPGRAQLSIHTDSGAITSSGKRVYFGLRLMGGEDIQMTGVSVVNNTGCIVSDFAGNNTPKGWQGNALFGTAAPTVGSGNSHMRMVGGVVDKDLCDDILINITFQVHPLVVFYGAFFGLNPAPWHDQYGTAPWSTIPTGGNPDYNHWWNLWGTFDTLGYSNACTSVTAGTVSCG